jgi:hypothetical protein
MSISTYSELKSSVANWLHRSDLTTVIPDFIVLAEADFNRRLRIATMEERATASFDEAFETVPSDFLEMREVKCNTSPVTTLQYMTPQQMTEFYPTTNSGTPTFYTLQDSLIRLNFIPTSEMEIAYYIRIPALTDDATTNWMLTNHPDVYLYGTLSAAEPYLENDKRLILWKSLYEAAVERVDRADKQSRWSGSTLQMRVSWQ